MNSVWVNVAVVAALILISGIFAAAEMALVSLRESQVQTLAHRGSRGRAIAKLTANPNRFLSAVQIGVTLAGFLSAAFGGATLSEAMAPHLEKLGLSHGAASTIALVLVTLVISYFSIVLGELTSKRLAMQRSESFSMSLAPLVDAVATAARPVIWFLGKSTDVAVRLLGGDPAASRESVTDEEIRAMVVQSQTLGIEERQIVDDVFDAGQRSLREVMVPRTEVDFLSGDLPAYKAIREVQGGAHSRYPVVDGGPDQVLGFLHVRDLMDLDPSSRSTPVKQLVRPITSFPETVRVLRALTEMRRHHDHLVLVLDEYGGTSGIVTLEDLVEELIGEITDEYDEPAEPHTTGEHDVAGLMSIEDFADRYGYELPDGPYDTVAGFVMAQLGAVPAVGDSVVVAVPTVEDTDDADTTARLRLSVTELDGRRAARLSLQRLPDTDPEAEGDATGEPETGQDVLA